MKYKTKYSKILTEEFLVEQYINLKYTTYEISKEVRCSDVTIGYYLKKFNIEIRSNSESHKDKKRKPLTVEHKQKISESNKGKISSKEHKQKISETRIKRDIGKGENNPFYGQKHSEKTKQKMKDNHVDNSGEKNSNWKGGLTKILYPKEFDKMLKLKIRKRDNYTCQICGMTEEEHLIVCGANLSIHHIDYDKQNCSEDDLTSLCIPCHIRTNYNRKYWKQYFQKRRKCGQNSS